jgi:hypothetical protein
LESDSEISLTHFGSQILQISTIETNSKLTAILKNIAQARRDYADFTTELRAADSTLRQHITTETATGHKKLAKSFQSTQKEEGSRLRQHVTRESNLNRELIVHHGHANRLAAAEHNASIKRYVKLEHMKTRLVLQEQVRTGRYEEIEAAQCSQFVSSLKFPEMNARRNHIVDPHSQTFEWIFDGDSDRLWDSFKQFLETPSSIYWVNGKAGSGKSSLMKYICEHDRCQQMLDVWSAPKSTLILSWYFWNSGTEIQKSLKGALCALVYQVLSLDQALALTLLQSHYLDVTKLAKDSVTDWSVTELVRLFKAALRCTQTHVTIFLDGLDEFNDDEDINPLLVLIEEVTTQPQVKACVSSRPDRYLESRLNSYPRLKLQDLTAKDISTYVTDRLRSAASNWEDSQIQTLAHEVRVRASGVFLWVRLVTDTLVRGLLHGDSQQVLSERLAKLPPKMESLYEHMWRSLNGDEDLESYRQQAAECFAFHQIFPMSVFELAMALDDGVQHKFIEGVHNSEVKMLLEKCCAIENLLKTRCAGLLEISSPLEVEDLEPSRITSFPKHQQSESPSPSSNRTSHGSVDANKSGSRAIVVSLAGEFPGNDALLLCLSRIGRQEIDFIHRTARDFLLQTIRGQQILRHCNWTTMDMITRLVNAYLQRQILGISESDPPEYRFIYPTVYSLSKYIDLNRLVALIFSIDGLQPTTAEWQYSLLRNIDLVHRTMVRPQNGASLSEWQENWYIYSAKRRRGVKDFWGSVAPYLSDCIYNRILSQRPDDPLLSTHGVVVK